MSGMNVLTGNPIFPFTSILSDANKHQFLYVRQKQSQNELVFFIYEIWIEEAEKRLKAYREGKLEGIPMEDIFNEKQ